MLKNLSSKNLNKLRFFKNFDLFPDKLRQFFEDFFEFDEKFLVRKLKNSKIYRTETLSVPLRLLSNLSRAFSRSEKGSQHLSIFNGKF